jgi:LysM repeat protein
VNATSQGEQATPERYTVREGETLQSIAQTAWGDASLWYMIAEANGLSAASAQLAAGTSLILPGKVTNVHENASTFRPYDAQQAIGDTSPTTPKPPKKPNYCCGTLGAAIIAATKSSARRPAELAYRASSHDGQSL